jgi:hypothetical protein
VTQDIVCQIYRLVSEMQYRIGAFIGYNLATGSFWFTQMHTKPDSQRGSSSCVSRYLGAHADLLCSCQQFLGSAKVVGTN